ncbi:prothymosin alpha-A-like [Macrosteles quadrilineatus]|uniref:prothymosin alpha-A-like n=1 Tax=Macrosteles quadrilineatus TaxID=74068 RepID=UPI0023E0C67A|nr:prothymosin alpha-A-like [Macrosteles quadrilineatus]
MVSIDKLSNEAKNDLSALRSLKDKVDLNEAIVTKADKEQPGPSNCQQPTEENDDGTIQNKQPQYDEEDESDDEDDYGDNTDDDDEVYRTQDSITDDDGGGNEDDNDDASDVEFLLDDHHEREQQLNETTAMGSDFF